MEGLRVLDEVSGIAGILLWQSLRDITLWAESPDEQRGQLFAGDAGRARTELIERAELDAELVGPLAALAGLVTEPATCSADSVSRACDRLSHWASARGRVGTALGYAQAASLANPSDASAALRVARLADRSGESARSETWYRRTITVARRAGDWTPYAYGLLGLGRLYRERGTNRVAQRFLIRALRASTRRGLHPIRVAAMRDLAALALDRGDFRASEAHLRRAFDIAGGSKLWLPRLAGEVARLRIAEGLPADAVEVLQALLPLVRRPAERVAVLGSLGRAAGEAELRGLFDQAWAELWPKAADYSGRHAFAAALLELARGASALGDRERAEMAAGAAAQAARDEGDRRIRAAAEMLARSLSNGSVGTPQSRSAGSTGEAGRQPDPTLISDLTFALQDRLQQPS